MWEKLELIKMDIHDYQGLVKPELIKSIQIHLYEGNQMTFTNLLIRETSKLLPPNIAPTFVMHSHPLNALAPVPFCILNQSHIKHKEETYKLILTLFQLSQQPDHGEEAEPLPQQSPITLSSVLKQCEEISQVATFLNEDDLNPYWLLFNPLLKLRQHLRLTSRRQEIISSSQFFPDGQHLNSDYFIYRLNLLQNYVNTIQREGLNRLTSKFVKICLIALLRHIQKNDSQLMKVVLQQPLLKEVEENKGEIMAQIEEIQKKVEEENKKLMGAYGNFNLPCQADPPNPPEEEYVTLNQKLMRALVKPVSVTVILLTLFAVLKK